MKILLLFVLIPLLELYVLIQVGGAIGALTTVLWVVASAFIGLALMRSQGLATMQKAQIAMAQGQAPQDALLEGVFIFIGGLLLFVPGLITDAVGVLFLITPVRQYFIKKSMQGQAYRFKSRTQGQYYDGQWSETHNSQKQLKHTSKGHVIEGELENPAQDDSKKS
ncbi:FxsA family protein [Thiomicrorhabdus aquaedulcis]|uniref:FxsA family protein n=1 Tax=Thiomicrorhabdus aquaedulcis TaxID=2211106 RepID=UPI000FD864E5|nr:FxsA family protein [Thiomicrorhabdus aquaedulcis]